MANQKKLHPKISSKVAKPVAKKPVAKAAKPVQAPAVKPDVKLKQVEKMIRGLDNESFKLAKSVSSLTEKISQANQHLSSMLSDRTNGPQTSAKPVVKAEKPEKPKTAPKLSKPVAKEKPAKPATVAKEKPVKAEKPAKPVAQPAGNDGRPSFKELVVKNLAKKEMTTGELYTAAEAAAEKGGFKVWSRQSLYNIIEKGVEKGEIGKSGEGATAKYSVIKADAGDEVDKFVTKVETSAESE
jgi:hypothetical protein